MNVISRGIRNAFRNTVRSVSLIVILGLSIGLSLAMLIAHQAVGDKIASVKATVGNTVSISPAGVRGFEGGGNPLTTSQLEPVKKLAHVTGVQESLDDRLTSSDTNLQSALDAGKLGRRFAISGGQGNGDFGSFGGGGQNPDASFTPPVTVIGTDDPSGVSSPDGQGGSFKLTSGKSYAAGSNDNVALVGKDLAGKNNLSTGSTFTAYNTTVTVAGIFDTGTTFGNSQLIMPLATVQRLSGQAGDITNATVTVDSVSNVSGVTSAIKKQLGSAADVTNASERAQDSIAPLENIRSISLYSLVGAVITGAVIILLTMIMIVRERRREIGVTKAIGASNFKIMSQFTAEAVTLTLLGAVLGILLGAVAGNPITHMLVTNSTQSGAGPRGGPGIFMSGTSGGGFRAGGAGGFRTGGRGLGAVRDNFANIHAAVGWSIILYGLAAALVIAIAGSALASYFIAKIRPAEVMRVE